MIRSFPKPCLMITGRMRDDRTSYLGQFQSALLGVVELEHINGGMAGDAIVMAFLALLPIRARQLPFQGVADLL